MKAQGVRVRRKVKNHCPRLIHLWGPFTHCCEENNGKCQSIRENRKITLWKHGHQKVLNHYWSAHDHCVCCCLRRKSVKLHGTVGIPLGWREQDYWLPQANQPKWPQLKYLTQHMVYAFYKNRICVFLSVLKKKQTHCTYMVWVAAQRLQSTTWGPRCNSHTTAGKIWHTRAKHLM